MDDLDYYLSLLPDEYAPGTAVILRLRLHADKIEIDTYKDFIPDEWILLDIRSKCRKELFNQLLKHSNLRLIEIKNRHDIKLIGDMTFIVKARSLAMMDLRHKKNRTIMDSLVNNSVETQYNLDIWCNG